MICGVLRAAWNLAKCAKTLDEEGLWMKPSAAAAASEAGSKYVRCYIWLAHESATKGVAQYKIRPKLHVFDHMFHDLPKRPLNPKSYSCFSDEDFVRRVCDIASGCSHLGILWSCVHRYSAAVYTLWRDQRINCVGSNN